MAEGRSRSRSDVDLAVAGLSPEALLTATAELDSLATAGQDPVIPIDLQLDRRIERDTLSALVCSLERLEGRMEAGNGSSETVDSAALRLQGLHTGVERCRQVRMAIASPGPEGFSGQHRGQLGAFLAAERFCLSSLQENFGIVMSIW